MTNANVVALNVQPAAPAKGAKGMTAGALDGSSKGKFDEALGRLQQEAQNELASAGKDDTPQDTEAGDGGSGREGVPQSPLAMVMALPVQQLVQEEVQTEAPAAVAEFSEGAPVSGDLIKASPDFRLAEQAPEQNLRSLLPQSDEVAVKNRDFLAMLSGDLTSSQRAEAQVRAGAAWQVETQQPAGILKPELPLQQAALKESGSLSAGVARQADMPLPQQQVQQPRNLWQLGQPLPEAEPADPLGLALRQAQRPLPQESRPQDVAAGQAEVKAAPVQAAQPQLAAAAAEAVPVKSEGLQALLGDSVTVETAEVQPLRVLRNQESQSEMSFGQNREGNSPAPQGEFAAALENEEAPAAAQPQVASSHLAAAPAVSFREQIQEVSVADMPQAPQEAQTDFQVPRQIVEQARLIRSSESTEMVIHLKPEHLGDLTLKISVTENGAVTASFHSDNAQVRTIIENSLVQLRQELNDQGLRVDSVEVFSGLPDGQLPQGQGQQAWQQGSQGRFASDRKPEDYADEADDLAAAALAQGEGNEVEDGVDYRV